MSGALGIFVWQLYPDMKWDFPKASQQPLGKTTVTDWVWEITIQSELSNSILEGCGSLCFWEWCHKSQKHRFQKGSLWTIQTALLIFHVKEATVNKCYRKFKTKCTTLSSQIQSSKTHPSHISVCWEEKIILSGESGLPEDVQGRMRALYRPIPISTSFYSTCPAQPPRSCVILIFNTKPPTILLRVTWNVKLFSSFPKGTLLEAQSVHCLYCFLCPKFLLIEDL